MTRNFQWLVATVIAISMATLCYADQSNSEATTRTNDATEARLGIGVSSLPEVLSSHLPEVIDDGRGVLVSEVMDGSAADKAGIKKLVANFMSYCIKLV